MKVSPLKSNTIFREPSWMRCLTAKKSGLILLGAFSPLVDNDGAYEF
jgi:hypothetical protein